jgi:4'-phosphopantetheinyl transferase EntD
MIATLVPPHVAVRECLIAGVAGVLADEEARCVATAVPKRQREFLAGRLCAHAALRELGMPRMTLPSLADRTPAWPDPVVGSITHSERHCAAAVALRSRVRAIGIDVEEIDRVDLGLLPLIGTAREVARIQVEERPVAAAALLFSAKEAFYKCQYTLSRAWVGFHDVEVDVLKPIESLPAALDFTGRFAMADGVVHTAVTVESREQD